MRDPLIAGNWKMNLLRAEGEALVDAVLAGRVRVPAGRDLLILPPFPWLTPLAERLRGTGVALGAQDLHWEPAGAFTSAVSGAMLRDAGCRYVLVGHSERREHFGDTSEVLARKLRAALAVGLEPIYCVGEPLEVREAGAAESLLARQLSEVLAGLEENDWRRLTLAYEPIWAIGTGRTATPEIAQQTHGFLRQEIRRLAGERVAQGMRILYGGSVKPDNAGTLLSQPDIDGALVGGASLKAESFLGIAAG